MSPRLVVWADHTGPYGVGRHTAMLTAGLSGRGWDVDDASEHAVDLFGERPMQAFEDRATPARVFAERSPDIVLFANASSLSNVAAIRAARDLGLARAVVVHLDALPPLPQVEVLAAGARAELQAASVVVTPSYAVLAHLPKGVVIPNGVPDAFFAPVAHGGRAPFGVPDDAVVCLSAARMEHEKGWDLLVDVIVVCESLHFVWAGDGTQRKRLSAVVRMLGLSDRVHVVGLVDDMPSLVGLCDIFVLPTRADAAPLALIEAMAAGLAIVATDVGDIARIVGDAGVVLPNPSIQSRKATVTGVVEALGQLGAHATRLDLGARARDRAEREHRASVMVDRYDELLRSLL